MKYVMFKTKHGQKIPVIFPEQLTHKEVADALMKAKPCPIPNVTGVDSAGYVKLDGVHCYGESLSLHKKFKFSDSSIIQRYDYFHGY